MSTTKEMVVLVSVSVCSDAEIFRFSEASLDKQLDTVLETSRFLSGELQFQVCL